MRVDRGQGMVPATFNLLTSSLVPEMEQRKMEQKKKNEEPYGGHVACFWECRVRQEVIAWCILEALTVCLPPFPMCFKLWSLSKVDWREVVLPSQLLSSDEAWCIPGAVWWQAYIPDRRDYYIMKLDEEFSSTWGPLVSASLHNVNLNSC